MVCDGYCHLRGEQRNGLIKYMTLWIGICSNSCLRPQCISFLGLLVSHQLGGLKPQKFNSSGGQKSGIKLLSGFVPSRSSMRELISFSLSSFLFADHSLLPLAYRCITPTLSLLSQDTLPVCLCLSPYKYTSHTGLAAHPTWLSVKTLFPNRVTVRISPERDWDQGGSTGHCLKCVGSWMGAGKIS